MSVWETSFLKGLGIEWSFHGQEQLDFSPSILHAGDWLGKEIWVFKIKFFQNFPHLLVHVSSSHEITVIIIANGGTYQSVDSPVIICLSTWLHRYRSWYMGQIEVGMCECLYRLLTVPKRGSQINPPALDWCSLNFFISNRNPSSSLEEAPPIVHFAASRSLLDLLILYDTRLRNLDQISLLNPTFIGELVSFYDFIIYCVQVYHLKTP